MRCLLDLQLTSVLGKQCITCTKIHGVFPEMYINVKLALYACFVYVQCEYGMHNRNTRESELYMEIHFTVYIDVCVLFVSFKTNLSARGAILCFSDYYFFFFLKSLNNINVLIWGGVLLSDVHLPWPALAVLNRANGNYTLNPETAHRLASVV